jgi:hypothetical protein
MQDQGQVLDGYSTSFGAYIMALVEKKSIEKYGNSPFEKKQAFAPFVGKKNLLTNVVPGLFRLGAKLVPSQLESKLDPIVERMIVDPLGIGIGKILSNHFQDDPGETFLTSPIDNIRVILPSDDRITGGKTEIIKTYLDSIEVPLTHDGVWLNYATEEKQLKVSRRFRVRPNTDRDYRRQYYHWANFIQISQMQFQDLKYLLQKHKAHLKSLGLDFDYLNDYDEENFVSRFKNQPDLTIAEILKNPDRLPIHGFRDSETGKIVEHYSSKRVFDATDLFLLGDWQKIQQVLEARKSQLDVEFYSDFMQLYANRLDTSKVRFLEEGYFQGLKSRF